MNNSNKKNNPIVFLVIISLAYLWANFHRQSMAVMAPFLSDSLGITEGQIGTLGSIIFYIYGLTQLPIGYFSSKFGPSRVIQFSLICLVIGTFIFGKSSTYTELLFGRLFIGFAVSGFYVPSLDLIRKWFGAKHFSYYLALFLSIGNIGALLSTTPYEILLSNFPIDKIYLVLTLVSVLLVVLSFALKEENINRYNPDIEEVMDTRLPKGFFVFYLMISLYGLAFYGSRQAFISLWGTTYYQSVFGYNIRNASILMMAISIGGIILSPISGRIADKYGRFKTLIVQNFLTCLLWGICAILPSSTPFLLNLFLAFWIGGLKISTVSHSFALITDYGTDKTRSLLTALLNATNFLGSGLMMQGLGFMFEGIELGRDIFMKVLLTFAFSIFITNILMVVSKKRMDKFLPNLNH